MKIWILNITIVCIVILANSEFGMEPFIELERFLENIARLHYHGKRLRTVLVPYFDIAELSSIKTCLSLFVRHPEVKKLYTMINNSTRGTIDDTEDLKEALLETFNDKELSMLQFAIEYTLDVEVVKRAMAILEEEVKDL